MLPFVKYEKMLINNHNCSNNGVPRINSTYTPAMACTILFFDHLIRVNNPPIIVPKITVIAASPKVTPKPFNNCGQQY